MAREEGVYIVATGTSIPEIVARLERIEAQIKELFENALVRPKIVLEMSDEMREGLTKAMKEALADLEQTPALAQDDHGIPPTPTTATSDNPQPDAEWRDFSEVQEELRSPGFPREGKPGPPEPQ